MKFTLDQIKRFNLAEKEINPRNKNSSDFNKKIRKFLGKEILEKLNLHSKNKNGFLIGGDLSDDNLLYATKKVYLTENSHDFITILEQNNKGNYIVRKTIIVNENEIIDQIEDLTIYGIKNAVTVLFNLN